jgi:beta-aspartyl-peptidase (threonine type)
MRKFGIAVHGGAGTILQDKMTREKEDIYTQALREALTVGYVIIEKGGNAVDAVEAAIRCLEDNPCFNAGRGAVFNHEGKHELDASIMDGKFLKAGAISCVKNIKNPITLAKEVMQHSEHVFLCAEGAEEFARWRGIAFAPDEYFFTTQRYEQWQHATANELMQLDHGGEKKFGTVGAVALDQQGNLAAATSTGGITNKRFGRVGDSPMIGAGTYANNRTCAVSCTGHGEYFIRAVVAYDVAALMEYKDMLLKEATDLVVNHKLVEFGAEGGLIAIDSFGNIEMPFNSKGMYRGYWKNAEEPVIAIYK